MYQIVETRQSYATQNMRRILCSSADRTRACFVDEKEINFDECSICKIIEPVAILLVTLLAQEREQKVANDCASLAVYSIEECR